MTDGAASGGGDDREGATDPAPDAGADGAYQTVAGEGPDDVR